MENTVLVAEDSKTMRKMIVNVLKDNYHVLEAENGREALDLLQDSQNHISAVIIDLIMPVMDGYQFLEVYSTSPEYVGIPVIVSTGESDFESESKCLERGAWDFIKKPYNPQIIRFRVKNVIERSELYLLKKFHYQEQFDELTGLYKKKTFMHQTQKMLRENPNMDFMMLHFDIYRFQLYNNVFGRAKGDELLCYIADILRKMAADKEHMTYCRLSGDAFCFCMPAADKNMLQKISDNFRKEFDSYQKQYHILASLGVFYIDNGEESIASMIDQAKLASKECKGNYIQNYCIYTPSIRKNMRDAQNIVSNMEQALKEEQFVLYLQPKYKLSSHKLEGAEVLVRWLSPDKGMISPGKFIPIFEKNGLIMKLDQYVWEHSCMLIRSWLDRGLEPFPISVNISRISLYNLQIVEEIYALTVKYNVPPRLFQLELTESAYMDHPETIKNAMRRLQEYGFTILMDDFGSGYSSLNVLKDISVDILKLDMKFMSTSDDGNQQRSESIVESVVGLAQNLHLPVIAEGVEQENQMEFLNNIGCEYGQGYYFAKPMSVEEYEKLAFHEFEEETADKAVVVDATVVLAEI